MTEYYPIIYYLGGIQGIILTIFLVSQKRNHIAYRILGLLTLVLGLLAIAFGMQLDGISHDYPHLLATFSRLLFLIFPLVFLTVKYLITKHEGFERLDYMHFIPFIIVVLIYIDFYPQSAADKIAILRDVRYYNIISIIEQEVLVIQGIGYSIVSLLILRRYKNEVIHYTSNTHKNLHRVIRIGLNILLIGWIIGSVTVNLQFFGMELGFNLFIFVYLLIVVDIYWISFNAIKSPELFKLEYEELFPASSVDIQESDNLSTSADEDENSRINNRLMELIDSEKPYLEPDLTLPELASRLDVSRNKLSRVINQIHKKNFFVFINTLRIEEVKSMINDPSNRNLKIISMAYDAGFNSKTSFNRVFKMITNMTPSQYQNTIK